MDPTSMLDLLDDDRRLVGRYREVDIAWVAGHRHLVAEGRALEGASRSEAVRVAVEHDRGQTAFRACSSLPS